ncbi:hypothetical protein L1049_017401 [Liquidambar formosana]|uniref:BED-type domain-containing protein n=1 Tax=Liquidambar formosana TaxID=63359 RepID=A0AAP0S144_LIQFO
MDLSDAVIVKSSRLKSVVWNDFDRVKKGDTCVAVCRHCKKKLSGSSTSGTSHLRNHLIRCRRRSNHDVAQLIATREKKKEGTLALANLSFDQEQKHDEALNLVNNKYEQGQARDGIVNVGNYNFDQKRSQYDLALMIIVHGYPLAMVEHVGFKIFVKNLQPLFDIVTFNRVEADCVEIYEKEKQKVYEVLDKLPEYYYPQIYGSSAPDRINDVSESIRALYNEHAICSPLASLGQGLAWQVGSGGGPGAGCLANVRDDATDRLTAMSSEMKAESIIASAYPEDAHIYS